MLNILLKLLLHSFWRSCCALSLDILNNGLRIVHCSAYAIVIYGSTDITLVIKVTLFALHFLKIQAEAFVILNTHLFGWSLSHILRQHTWNNNIIIITLKTSIFSFQFFYDIISH